jgi:protein involved in polysaccharide export with SLBB domain
LRNIQLKRNGKTVANFDLYDLIVYGDTTNDIRLEQGDVLFVPTAENVISIEGQVRRPAIYEMLEGESVETLLKLSGGFLPSADFNAIQLVRSLGSDGLSILNINYKDKKSLNTNLKNGDFVRVPKANQEFSNAIIINGAVNLPSVVANTGLSLSNLVTNDTILANTDLNYALLLRKSRFEARSTVIQFKPIDVLNREYDIDLQAFDELILFNRVVQDVAQGIAESVTRGGLKTSQDDLKTKEAKFLQQVENDRFTTGIFGRNSNTNFSRKALLAPIIARLKSEANEKTPVQLIEINGQVKYPGVYPLATDASLSALVTAAGGLTESAHLERAEITRVELVNGVSEIEHKQVNLLQQFLLQTNEQLMLKSKDVLNVVRIPQWYENKTIVLKGKVVFPGTYQISQGETLSSIITRAGGLTKDASVKAAVFTREELKEKELVNVDKAIEDLRQQLANNNLSNSQFSRNIDYENATKVLNDLSDVEPMGRMVIDLESLLAGKKSADIQVKDGDLLVIPNVTPAVSIIGEVFVSTTYLYDDSLDIMDYIELAGGAREYADESKIYIVRADGSVMVPESSFWFSNDERLMLEPGDTIVVPRDVTNYDNIGLWQGLSQIIYQSAIALAAIKTL